ncbi:MAG TPA: lysine--tRNA ligase [Roseiarcus sp.]|nr:lysine--tRNA ligase [Roseiarcus sp.]
MSQAALRDAAEVSKAWPFEEARKLIGRVKRTGQRQVLFETGYGPSGLPHLGTFGEVARTTMVRHAFRVLTNDEIETRLLAFSDDMDGLRKTPDNIPNRAMVEAHLGKPLTEVPDPFGQYDSFAAHNNARLRRFLDGFGFDYEFASSTEYYKSGRFDAALLHMLKRFEAVQEIMLPSLREERAATYSPFLPIHPRTRIVMQVPLIGFDAEAGTIRWRDPQTQEEFETPVTGGHCKLQWKPDWAMRWYALGVDYEMAGKDLIDSVKLSSQIARALGAEPPAGFNYELFLDEKGQKISKSKGNGLAIEEWLTYASPESLSLFMFQKPTAAKRLYFDVIPRTVDDYLGFLDAYPRQEWKERLGNPVWHVHSGAPPAPEKLAHGPEAQTSVSFVMLLNLAAVANSDNPAVLWGFLRRYAPSATPENHPRLDRLVHYAVAYFRDFVAPKKRYRAADEVERAALTAVSAKLAQLPAEASAEDIQHALYDIARPIPRYQDLSAKGATPERPGVSNEFFNMIYAVLLGEERGPRLGSFIALYGIEETRALIAKALAGEFVGAA